jgi:hypothetical protein
MVTQFTYFKSKEYKKELVKELNIIMKLIKFLKRS